MSSRKRQRFDELVREIRASQGATDRYDQAVADALGLNRTDMRLVDLLDREGRATAGELAAQSGLTTGAITTALDRLEEAGYARRIRDAADRRRVFVELAPGVRERAWAFYAEHSRLAEALYRRYSEQEIELLLEFVRRGRLFNERKAAELEATLADSRRRGRGRGRL